MFPDSPSRNHLMKIYRSMSRFSERETNWSLENTKAVQKWRPMWLPFEQKTKDPENLLLTQQQQHGRGHKNPAFKPLSSLSMQSILNSVRCLAVI